MKITIKPAQEERRHFHTFDALRFFAFLKVFLLHLPIVAFPVFNYISAGGGIGVQFFFVLSGFLISYIILEEQENNGKFNLKHFFVRRVLRIWPLYYLMILVAFSMPYITEQLLHISTSPDGYEPDWWMSSLFLENYKMMATGRHPNVSPLGVMWSLCIEEHFYIIWGLLLFFLKKKYLPVIIAVSIITGLTCRIIYAQQGIPALDICTNIDLFAYGAIPAYLLIKRPAETEHNVQKIPHVVKRLFAVLLVVAVLICSQYTKNEHLFAWLTSLLGILFSILILFTLPKKTKFSIGDNTFLSKLGVYTYGLYLYHTLVINLLKQVLPKAGLVTDTVWGAGVFFTLSLAGTVVLSMISYHLFEKQFLKLKKRFR